MRYFFLLTRSCPLFYGVRCYVFTYYLIAFFAISGLVQHEYVPKGQTVDQHVHKEVLIHLQEAIRRKRPELWSSGDYYLHHDNAKAHTAWKVRNYLAKNKVSVLPQPPYSADLAPCNFYLFPKLKIVMKGQCYDDVDAIQQKMMVSSDTSQEEASNSACKHVERSGTTVLTAQDITSKVTSFIECICSVYFA